MALNNIPGLAGYLGMRNQDRSEAMGNLQAVQSGIGSILRMQEAERAAQMAPLQQQIMQAQLQAAQAQAAERARISAFYSPENMRQFMTPGQAAVAPGQGVTGGMDEGGLGQILGIGPTEQGAPAAQPAEAPRLDLARLVEAGAAAGVIKPETVLNMQGQQQARMDAINVRRQQLIDQRERAIRDAQNDADRIAANRMYQQGLLELRRDMANFRMSGSGGSGGGAGDGRRPETFSVNGRNVAGLIDRYGNRYMPDGQLARNVEPAITTADQKQAQDAASALQAFKFGETALNRMEDLMLGTVDPKTGERSGGSPMSIAGPMSGALGVARYLLPGVDRPGTEFSQLIEVALNSFDKAGKLSNQQKNELRSVFKTGMLGDKDSVLKGIELMRQYAGIRGAASNTAVGRVRPGSPAGNQVTQNAPAGIDPKVWNVMTPEERALWQK
jgi:hypothetical protein